MNFRRGQKVVCIDATQPRVGGRDHLLKRGDVYTIAATGLTHPLDPRQMPCVELMELADHICWAHRFRPAVERKTDISIFARMLTPNKERVEQ